jgi:hypothetical protein
MLFKRSAKSVSEIGRELSADYLPGEACAATAIACLYRPADRHPPEVHLWVETYDDRLVKR